LHQGGQISAPVFSRIAQQVLEYLHTPHDLEIPPNRQVLLARANAHDKDLEEGSPDHPGETIDVADAAPTDLTPSVSGGTTFVSPIAADANARLTKPSAVVPAAMRQREPQPPQVTAPAPTGDVPTQVISPPNSTVVLDVEQGGIVVPSFAGKSVRSAIELAESSGLDLDVVGSGLGQEQNPPAGAHVPTGARITVKFGR
jgi:cell division protein FtsI (penicillin-binding protein 3)